MFIENFKVVAVSSNRNSFGLKQLIVVAKNGKAFQTHANDLNCPKRDQIIAVPFNVQDEKVSYEFTQLGFEVTTQLQDCPEAVLKEIYSS